MLGVEPEQPVLLSECSELRQSSLAALCLYACACARGKFCLIKYHRVLYIF